jgi:hypothetical protein
MRTKALPKTRPAPIVKDLAVANPPSRKKRPKWRLKWNTVRPHPLAAHPGLEGVELA